MNTLYLALGFSLVFILLAFVITEKNAKYYLAGYNSMTEEERSTFDIASFMKKWRIFHIFLGVSLLALAWLAQQFFDDTISMMTVVVYPLLAYLVLSFFVQHSSPRSKWISISVLAICLVTVIALLYSGQRPNHIFWEGDELVITGSYGAEVQRTDILSIDIVDSLPKTNFKSNGYAMGDVKKGIFKTDAGSVRLISDRSEGQHLHIRVRDGRDIYYTGDAGVLDEVIQGMK